MNYQLLIESYSFGSALTEQEIELLSLELETQIMNINISTEFGCFKSAPSHICESLNLKKDTFKKNKLKIINITRLTYKKYTFTLIKA